MSKNVPFDAVAVSGSHSALSGVLAGFALAALFLLIDRGDTDKDVENERGEIREQYLRAMLLLFVSFLVGVLASYLYSGITGEPKVRGFLLFSFPSALLAIQVFVLLTGIHTVFSVYRFDYILNIARYFNYTFICFGVAFVCVDLMVASRFFGLPSWMTWGLPIIATILVVIGFLIRWRTSLHESGGREALQAFCYSCLIFSFVIALLVGISNYSFDRQPELPIWLPVLLIICVSGLGAGTILITPPKLIVTVKK